MSAPTGSTPSFARLLASETSKLATLPAVSWTLAATGVLAVLTAALFSSLYLDSAATVGTRDLLDVALRSIEYVQAGFLILGVLAIAAEYPGMIRTTLTTTPRRVRVHLAKAVALTGHALPAAAAVIVTSVVLARVVLGDAVHAPEAGPALGRLASATAYLALTALIAFAVATLLRRTIPAVAVVLGYFVVAGPLLRHAGVLDWAPDTAGYALWYPSNAPPDLTTPVAWIAVIAWTVALLAAATAAFRVRDA